MAMMFVMIHNIPFVLYESYLNGLRNYLYVPKLKKSQHVRVSLRGVAGEVLWYPKSDFEIVTRVTLDV